MTKAMSRTEYKAYARRLAEEYLSRRVIWWTHAAGVTKQKRGIVVGVFLLKSRMDRSPDALAPRDLNGEGWYDDSERQLYLDAPRSRQGESRFSHQPLLVRVTDAVTSFGVAAPGKCDWTPLRLPKWACPRIGDLTVDPTYSAADAHFEALDAEDAPSSQMEDTIPLTIGGLLAWLRAQPGNSRVRALGDASHSANYEDLAFSPTNTFVAAAVLRKEVEAALNGYVIDDDSKVYLARPYTLVSEPLTIAYLRGKAEGSRS